MSGSMTGEIVDWTAFGEARKLLGANFARLLGYFREDGFQAVEQIEEAMRSENACDIVLPAHKLKGESAQLGAQALSEKAEYIEMVSRACVEHHDSPDELVADVAQLRALFEKSLQLLEAESSPLVQRRAGGFGRRGLN